ncbi:MAG: hypothetical protein V8S27_01600 [Lachnospiraceae bacterium]
MSLLPEALGASKLRILMFDIIRNGVSSVLIMATTDIGNKILMFSTLSFLDSICTANPGVGHDGF